MQRPRGLTGPNDCRSCSKKYRSVADGVRTIVATATFVDDINEGKDIINGKVAVAVVAAAAIVRKEQRDGPFVIGPMMGSGQAVLPVIRAIARSVPDCESDNNGSTKVSILISDHLDLMDRLKLVGFEPGFDFPDMLLDGRYIYDNGDGSYLSLIHPTLG